MRILRRVKEFFIKYFNKIWNKIDKDEVLTEVEQLAFDIFKFQLEDDKNIRFINSGFSIKRYIINKSYLLDKKNVNTLNTFIILNSSTSKIVIVNHQYKYDISLPVRTCDKMRKMFDVRVEEDREKMEKEILGNITDSLEIVLKKMKDKFK